MANDGGLSLSAVAQVAQPVTDLERSIDFYRDTLGGTFIAKFDPPGLAFFDCGGVRLMLDAVEGALEPPAHHCTSGWTTSMSRWPSCAHGASSSTAIRT